MVEQHRSEHLNPTPNEADAAPDNPKSAIEHDKVASDDFGSPKPSDGAALDKDSTTNRSQDSETVEKKLVSKDEHSPSNPKQSAQGKLLAHLKQLDTSVIGLRKEVAETADFSLRAKDALFHQAEEVRLKGMMDALEPFFQVHDAVFAQVQSMEAGERGPDGFLNNLLHMIEGQLERLEVEVIRPQPGQQPIWERGVMKAVASRKRPFWRGKGTIAAVRQCGFQMTINGRPEILRPAAIETYHNR